ncbi:PADRE domain [Dillenia turbinata]|uniref:PADRE domain n=1 Tax=Dillenia turbinata TaxID=194707 RepID=A0AAN8W9A3_9MAGN
MGNCLVLQQQVIRIVKTDGKVMEYKAPIKVHQVLSDFSGYAISDMLPVLQHLRPETEMHSGQLYYLIPLPPSSVELEKKLLNISKPEKKAEQETGILRIKLVISKQELKEMLSKGRISADDILSRLPNKEKITWIDRFNNEDDGRCRGWMPKLESIPEIV